ncbi:MAG: hypothetical protein K6C98_05515 [Treponema sp.]|nr:hypothetical protein [Treponema sp.]
MKKIIAVAAALLVSAAAWSQVMSEPGVKNTLSVSFGKSYLDNSAEYDPTGLRFFGFVDTVQTRIDIKKCTVDAMLNWGALTNDEVVVGKFTDDFYFANTKITPFWYTNHYQDGTWWTNGYAESYYVNFIYHPHKYWDLGMGTRLDWKVGPAPSYNGNLWEPFCHIVQGGLKDAIPGQADVVGYTYYANSYTAYYAGQTKSALGIRFHYEDFIEIGGAIPSGVTTDKPVFNAGAKIHPADFLTISAGVDGLFRSTGNLYGGATIAFKPFILDAYLGIDYKEDNKENGGRWGTGAALTFNFSKINLMLKPEAGFTFYTYADYTMASYGGIRVNWELSDKIVLGGWSSLAFGSKNSAWEDVKEKEDYWGGSIFDLRPDFTWIMDKNNSFTAFLDFQHRNNYAHEILNTWATGVYWNYKSSK